MNQRVWKEMAELLADETRMTDAERAIAKRQEAEGGSLIGNQTTNK